MNITICSIESVPLPEVPWVNIFLAESMVPRYADSRKATVITQNPDGQPITLEELRQEVEIIFGLYGIKFVFISDGNILNSLEGLSNGSTLVVSRNVESDMKSGIEISFVPFSRFVNSEYNGKNYAILLENPVNNKLPLHDVLETVYPNVDPFDIILY